MTSRQLAGYHVIRLAVASVFLVHALARIGLGIVDDFAGYWMATFGVSRSAGLVASWTVTGVELIGGLLNLVSLVFRFFSVRLSTPPNLPRRVFLPGRRHDWVGIFLGDRGCRW
jgi:uncharacterized membrane protein YphA (DoxX/SURF4 family)